MRTVQRYLDRATPVIVVAVSAMIGVVFYAIALELEGDRSLYYLFKSVADVWLISLVPLGTLAARYRLHVGGRSLTWAGAVVTSSWSMFVLLRSRLAVGEPDIEPGVRALLEGLSGGGVGLAVALNGAALGLWGWRVRYTLPDALSAVVVYIGSLSTAALGVLALSVYAPGIRDAWGPYALLVGPAVVAAGVGLKIGSEGKFGLAGACAVASLYGFGSVFIANVLQHTGGANGARVSLAALANANPGYLLGAVFTVVVCGTLLRLGTHGDDGFKRPWSSALGDAQWMPMSAARKLFPSDGDVVVGEAYRPDVGRRKGKDFIPGDKRTWGRGGRAPILAYKMDFDSTHMLFFAGSGGYKTTSTVIPTALRYRGSMVVLDPAQEIGDTVGPVRRAMIGLNGLPRRVIILDPEDDTHMGTDVLALLREHRHKQQILGAYVNLILDEKPKAQSGGDAFFAGTTFGLLSGLLMYIIVCPFRDIAGFNCGSVPNLRHLRKLASMSEKDLQNKLRKICEANASAENRALSMYIADASDRAFVVAMISPFVTMADQSWSGIAATVSSDTKWLSTDAFASMVAREPVAPFERYDKGVESQAHYERRLAAWTALTKNYFAISDMPKGNIDVFIQVKGLVVGANKGLLRMLIGGINLALMEERQEVGGSEEEIAETRRMQALRRPVLFCLDEVSLLGYMSILLEARDRGRKFKISLMMMYQSVAQLEEHFGKDGAQGWFDSAAIVSYAAIKAADTSAKVSKAVGEATVAVAGSSRSASWVDGIMSKQWAQSARVTYSENLQKRPLLLEHEVREMRSDAQIILVRGQSAILCGRAIFFRRPEMLLGLGKSRVQAGVPKAGAVTPETRTKLNAAIKARFTDEDAVAAGAATAKTVAPVSIVLSDDDAVEPGMDVSAAEAAAAGTLAKQLALVSTAPPDRTLEVESPGRVNGVTTPSIVLANNAVARVYFVRRHRASAKTLAMAAGVIAVSGAAVISARAKDDAVYLECLMLLLDGIAALESPPADEGDDGDDGDALLFESKTVLIEQTAEDARTEAIAQARRRDAEREAEDKQRRKAEKALQRYSPRHR
jgi:type IV secretion system protein VirD4